MKAAVSGLNPFCGGYSFLRIFERINRLEILPKSLNPFCGGYSFLSSSVLEIYWHCRQICLNPFCGGYSFLSSIIFTLYSKEIRVLILFVVDIPF